MNWIIAGAAVLYLFGSYRKAIFFAAVAVEVCYLGMRGVSLGRLPLIGPHDTLIFFSCSIGLMAIPFVVSAGVRGKGAFSWATGCLAGFFGLFALLFPAFAMPLPPVLDTVWFELHVALAFFAYALFGIGAVLGAFFLQGGDRRMLDLQYRAALVGYSFFSASMIAGGIWGYYAWGTYWLWTPKELWTSILWLFYTLYLHLRIKGVQGEKVVAWAGIVGFLITLFTYLGVSMLMKSSHSF